MVRATGVDNTDKAYKQQSQIADVWDVFHAFAIFFGGNNFTSFFSSGHYYRNTIEHRAQDQIVRQVIKVEPQKQKEDEKNNEYCTLRHHDGRVHK